MDESVSWLARELGALREERNLPRQDFSIMCGKYEQWWGRIETGYTNPTLDDIDIAAGALGYELHAMVP